MTDILKQVSEQLIREQAETLPVQDPVDRAWRRPPWQYAALPRNRSARLGARPSVISHPGENILHLPGFS